MSGPVTVRRRSAAQGCANAHPDCGAHRRAVGSLGSRVGSIESWSVSDMIWRLAGNYMPIIGWWIPFIKVT